MSRSTLWRVLAVALPVLGALVAPLQAVDLTYHLRAGAEILDTGSIPSVDTWTFTVNGTPWLDQQWGAQVLLELTYRLASWTGLVILRAILVGLASGDNTAYSVLVSRYMQSIQHARGGILLNNAEAALRTACLTGVATVKMSKTVTTPDGNSIALTAGDVDEAVTGILTNGLAASDVNGESVPSGFSRIDAFRVRRVTAAPGADRQR